MNEITINSNVVNTIKIAFNSKEKEPITGNIYINSTFPTRIKIVKLSSSLLQVTFPRMIPGTYKMEIKSSSNSLKTDVVCLYSSNEHEQKYDHVNPTFVAVVADEITVNNISSDNIESSVAKFGGDVNYTEFYSNGTMKMYGDATVYDDVTYDAIGLQKQGPGISDNFPEGCVEFLTTANQADYLIINAQLPHARKNGVNVYPHIHFWQAQNTIPNFAIQYRWQVSGGAKTTAWTARKCNTLAFTYTSGTINQIAYVDGGVAPPSGDTISDIFQWRVLRDTTNALGLTYGADPYTTTVQIMQCDIHIQKDDLGSETEYGKYVTTTTTTAIITTTTTTV